MDISVIVLLQLKYYSIILYIGKSYKHTYKHAGEANNSILKNGH